MNSKIQMIKKKILKLENWDFEFVSSFEFCISDLEGEESSILKPQRRGYAQRAGNKEKEG